MSVSDEQKEQAENLRTEYATIEAYHRSLVHYRFIILGAYFAGVGFLAKSAFEAEPKIAIWSCGYAFLFTVCAWMLELRTRMLYCKLGRRGEQIEHEFWGYRGANWYAAMWSSQYKSPPPPGEPNVPPHQGSDRASISLIGQLPEWLSKCISHSAALDLLYFVSAIVWVKLWVEHWI